MSEIAAPVASSLGESLGKSLGMGADVHERIARLESARDVLRAARTPPTALPVENVPLPPSFEEALMARAAHAAAHAPPPPPPPPPPETPADPSIRLWTSEREPALAGSPDGPPVGVPVPLPGAAAAPPADPGADWRPAAVEAPPAPVVVDPQVLAEDPRSVFTADVIEALRTRHLGGGLPRGDLPLRAADTQTEPGTP